MSRIIQSSLTETEILKVLYRQLGFKKNLLRLFLSIIKIMEREKNLTKIKTSSNNLWPVLCIHTSIPPLLPSTAHLYSYQHRYRGSLYPFNIVSLYRFSVPLSFFKELFFFVWTLFDIVQVTYRKFAMSYFHYHEWLFLYSWLFKHFEEIVMYHNWYYQHITPIFFIYMVFENFCENCLSTFFYEY